MLRDVFSQAQLCWVLPVQVLKQLIYLCVYNRDVCAGVQVCRCVCVCGVCVWCVCVCVLAKCERVPAKTTTLPSG